MLYIHAGMGKTGTTSIQYFSKNVELSSRFFHYLSSGLHGDGHHLLALNCLKSQNWTALIDEISSQEEKGNNSTKPYFISTENLFFEDPEFLKEVKVMLDKKNISHKVIIGYRSFSGYALSTYLEYVSQGRLPVYLQYEQFLDDHLQSIRLDKRISNFINSFEMRPIYYNFDEGRTNGHLRSFFKTWLKNFPHDVDSLTTTIRNQSLTQKGAIVANVFAGYLSDLRGSSTSLFSEREHYERFASYGNLNSKVFLDAKKMQIVLKNKFIEIIEHVNKVNTPNRIFNMRFDTSILFNQIASLHEDEQLNYAEDNFSVPEKYKLRFAEIQENLNKIINANI